MTDSLLSVHLYAKPSATHGLSWYIPSMGIPRCLELGLVVRTRHAHCQDVRASTEW